MQTSALDSPGGQSQLIQQLMALARANASQADSSAAASSTQSSQGDQPGTTAAAPAAGTTPADMFSGQTLGALTSAQEGASNLRQAIDSFVANQIVSQVGSNGGVSLSQIENAIGGSGGTTSGASASSSTSTNTPSTLDGLAGAFSALDTNGDGQLSADELTNALNQMTGPGQVQGHHGHHHHQDDGDADAVAGSGGGSTTGATGTTSSSTSSNTVSTLDSLTSTSGATGTASNSTSSNSISTLDGLTNADIAQALQAFLNSLAQSQAANLNALGQTTNPTSVTA